MLFIFQDCAVMGAIGVEILCWFWVGECIGKGSLVGYKVDPSQGYIDPMGSNLLKNILWKMGMVRGDTYGVLRDDPLKEPKWDWYREGRPAHISHKGDH